MFSALGEFLKEQQKYLCWHRGGWWHCTTWVRSDGMGVPGLNSEGPQPVFQQHYQIKVFVEL